MGVGSIAVGAWIARVVFVILVVESVAQDRLRAGAIAVGIAIAGWLLLSRVNPDLITPFVAIIDIGLVFAVLGRDVRLN